MRGSGVGSAGQAQSLLGATVTPTPEYRTIPLTQGHSAIVDVEDYESFSAHKWYSRNHGRYAARIVSRKVILMHRAMLNAPANMYVDHINGNGLDNRRGNLRLATALQNQQNARLRYDNIAGLKGVSWSTGLGRWKAQIADGGKRRHLGYFSNPEEAYVAYCEAAKKYHGEFARLA